MPGQVCVFIIQYFELLALNCSLFIMKNFGVCELVWYHMTFMSTIKYVLYY